LEKPSVQLLCHCIVLVTGYLARAPNNGQAVDVSMVV